jgi:hypothetical protein
MHAGPKWNRKSHTSLLQGRDLKPGPHAYRVPTNPHQHSVLMNVRIGVCRQRTWKWHHVVRHLVCTTTEKMNPVLLNYRLTALPTHHPNRDVSWKMDLRLKQYMRILRLFTPRTVITHQFKNINCTHSICLSLTSPTRFGAAQVHHRELRSSCLSGTISPQYVGHFYREEWWRCYFYNVSTLLCPTYGQLLQPTRRSNHVSLLPKT